MDLGFWDEVSGGRLPAISEAAMLWSSQIFEGVYMYCEIELNVGI